MQLDLENVTCGSDGQVNIEQDMVMESIAKNIAENVVNTSIKNSLSAMY